MLFGVKASSNLFTHLFINVKLGVAGIVEYGTFERVYFSADQHLSLLVSILEARNASIIVFLLNFSLCVVERLMLAFILDSCKHYWVSIQRGRAGHCSQARQVFVGCLQKEANKETATHKKGFSCKLLQNCPQVISPGPKLKPCSLSGKIKVMQSKYGIAQERLETLQSELKDQFHVCTVS